MNERAKLLLLSIIALLVLGLAACESAPEESTEPAPREILLLDEFSGSSLDSQVWQVLSGSPRVSGGQLSVLVPNIARIWTTQSFAGDFSIDVEIAEFQRIIEAGTVMRNRMTFFLSSDVEAREVRLEFVRREDRVEIRYGGESDGAGVSAMRGPFTVSLRKHGPHITFVVDGQEIGPFNHPFGDQSVYFGMQTWSDSLGPVGSIYDRITIYQ